MLDAKAEIGHLSAEDVVMMDSKVFEIGGRKLRVSVVDLFVCVHAGRPSPRRHEPTIRRRLRVRRPAARPEARSPWRLGRPAGRRASCAACVSPAVFKGSPWSSFSDAIAHMRKVSGRRHRDDEHTFADPHAVTAMVAMDQGRGPRANEDG